MRCHQATQEHDATARALYDNPGRYDGFVRYHHPM
jgi:hypothetical protein